MLVEYSRAGQPDLLLDLLDAVHDTTPQGCVAPALYFPEGVVHGLVRATVVGGLVESGVERLVDVPGAHEHVVKRITSVVFPPLVAALLGERRIERRSIVLHCCPLS